MKTSLITTLCFVALLGLTVFEPLFAADLAPSVQLTRSHEHRMASKAVGDEFVIRVRLPEEYDPANPEKYPVLYVLDADYWFGAVSDIAHYLPMTKEAPPTIVVGLCYGKTNEDWWQKRARDYTPKILHSEKSPEKLPLAGAADKFQQFLADEVFPLIEKTYAARPDHRTLVGLSFGGTFAVHTLFTHPELFQGYIILAPALHWDQKQLYETEAAFFAKKLPLPATVFFSIGDKDGKSRVANWREFDERVRSRNYKGLRWTSHLFPDESHITVYPVGFTRGLKAMYQPVKAEQSFRFSEATIDQLQEQMATGKLTARELTAAYLDRIAKIDRAGPTLRAVIETNPDALIIAEQLDAERKAGKVRGPLHGIPVLIKDNIGTADKMETTAGSLALVGAKPPHDAFIVTRLRDAGAVILGKTNLSEWAYARSENASSGWSARGGQTRNPYVLDRSPGGSSSGSAVAVAANLCVVAVGTETDGSIVSPASLCGVVGLKPTVGLVSRTGIIPGVLSQDTSGPMARTVRDAAILLDVLAGADPADTANLRRPSDMPDNFANALKSGALRGTRLGLMPRRVDIFPSLNREEKAVVAALRLAGAEVVELKKLPSGKTLADAEYLVFDYELKDGLNAWLGSLGPNVQVKSLADLIAFNEQHREQEMRFCGQELFLQAEAKGPLTEKAYVDALATSRRLAREEGLDTLFQTNRLDAIVALTCGPAFATDPVYGNRSLGLSSKLAAVAGYPNITVPTTDLFGLPVGVSFIGPAWSDARMLSLAVDFEAQTRARREPRFLPTIENPPAML